MFRVQAILEYWCSRCYPRSASTGNSLALPAAPCMCMYVYTAHIALLFGLLHKKSCDSPSGSKSTPISTPSALLFPTTLALPASPKSPFNLSYARAFLYILQGASMSSAGSFSLLNALLKPRQRSLRWTASAVLALS